MKLFLISYFFTSECHVSFLYSCAFWDLMLLVSNFIPLWTEKGLADGRQQVSATRIDRQGIRNAVGLSLMVRCHSLTLVLMILLTPATSRPSFMLCWLGIRGETPYCSNATDSCCPYWDFVDFLKINVSLINVHS